MKKIIFSILAIILAYYYYNYSFNAESNKTEEIQKSKEDILIEELADKHEAIIDWDNDIKYTTQLQKIITNKTIVFNGVVKDIFKNNKKNIIRWDVFSYNVSHDYLIDLECNDDIIKRLQDREEDTYIVVASIKEVGKPIWKLYSDIFYDENIANAYIEDYDMFFLKGSCVDVIYFEDDDDYGSTDDFGL